MLRRVTNFKDNGDLWVKAVDTQRGEIWFGIKDEAIGSLSHWLRDEKEWFHSSIRIGPRMAQLGPRLIGVLYFETNCDAAGRGAT